MSSPSWFGPIVALILLIICSKPLHAQTAPVLEEGLKPYGSFQGGDLDSIDLASGNVTLHVPLISYPQRGLLKLDFFLRDNNRNWVVNQRYSGSTLNENWIWKGTGVTVGWSGDWTYTAGNYTYVDTNPSPIPDVVTDPTGAPHLFAFVQQGSSYLEQSSDGTGLRLYAPYSAPTYSTPGWSTVDRNGVTYAAPGNTFLTNFVQSVTDPNGNHILRSITADQYNNLIDNGWSDSVGRYIPGGKISSYRPAVTFTGGSPVPRVTSWIPGTPISGIGSCPSGTGYAQVWSPPMPQGTSGQYVFCLTQIQIATQFNLGYYQSSLASSYRYVTESSGAGPVLLTGIVLPNGQQWAFTYDAYGDISQITLPTGGTISYQWTTESPYAATDPTLLGRVVTQRTVDAHDGSGAKIWQYSYNPNSYITTVTDPDLNDTVHVFSAYGNGTLLYETEARRYQGSQSSGTLLKTIDTHYTVYGDYNTTVDAVLPDTITITLAGSTLGSSKVVQAYDTNPTASVADPSIWPGGFGSLTLTNGAVISKQEFNYGASLPTRQTAANYIWQVTPAYFNANLLALSQSTISQDGNGSRCSETDYGYDQHALVATSGLPGHTSPPNGVQGNLSTITRWVSQTPCVANASWRQINSQSYEYDTGMVQQTVDPLNHPTSYSYDGGTGTFVVQTTNALNQHVSGGYDTNAGLLTSFTDLNNQTSMYSYDNMFRLHNAYFPDGGETDFNYYDSQNQVERRQKIDTAGDKTDLLVSFDGLGREARRATANNNGVSPWDQSDTCYDNEGRVSYKTYSYQGAGLANTSRVCPGAGSPLPGDTTGYDALSRMVSVSHSDGSVVNTHYSGSTTDVQEEGHPGPGGTIRVERVSQMNALGQLTNVCEVSGNSLGGQSPSACGLDYAATGYLTSYGYDPLGNLVSAQQAGLPTRSFAYDSLSRLLSSANPESGTTSYSYNDDSTMASRTRPLANQTNAAVTVTTNYSYDALHRLSNKTYTDTTAPASYSYDYGSQCSSPSNNCVGHLVDEYTGSAGSKVTETVPYKFDPMGREQNQQSCLPGGCGVRSYEQDYTYNVLGGLLTATDGFGDTLSWSYDGVAGRLSGMQASFTGQVLLSGLQYDAFGQSFAQLGDGHQRQDVRDARGRIGSITYSNPSTRQTVYQAAMGYAADSNMTSASDTVNGNWSYSYDEFNRLQTGYQPVGQYAGMTLSWGYDRYGNRMTQSASGGSGSVGQPSYTFANNRIAGFCYDAAGNLLDQTSPCPGGNHQYAYDAEGRLTSTAGVQYVYDAEGLRAAKENSSGTPTNLYLHDQAGQQLAEIGGLNNLLHTNLYANGGLVGTYGGGTIHYAYSDWLGTKRYQTDASGNYQSSWTSLPFGDSLTSSGSGPDATEQHFTGKERDSESGLDYFGARYYSSTMGRWMSPDWSDKPEAVPYSSLDNPQSLNLYGYVGNNSMSRTDKDGHSDVVYDTRSHTLTLYNGKGAIIGSWHANNLVDRKATLQKLPNGRYSFQDTKAPHLHSGVDRHGVPLDSAKGQFGSYGIFRLKTFDVSGVPHSGVGVHSGREGVPDQTTAHGEGPDHVTEGCLRTSDAAMQSIVDTANSDPLNSLTVDDAPDPGKQVSAENAQAADAKETEGSNPPPPKPNPQ